jgi:hypothetical protein
VSMYYLPSREKTAFLVKHKTVFGHLYFYLYPCLYRTSHLVYGYNEDDNVAPIINSTDSQAFPIIIKGEENQ